MIELDTDKILVRVNGKERKLPRQEFQVLKCIAEGGGKVVAREAIVRAIWGEHASLCNTRTIDQHIARARRRLGVNPVRTVVGFGYAAEGMDLANGSKRYGTVVGIDNRGFLRVKVDYDAMQGMRLGSLVRVA
jgi:hypothetical protein